MGGYWLQIGLIALLMLLNAVLAGSEIAFVSLREGQIREHEREASGRSRALVRLANDPNRFLATIQIGITLAGYLASATAAVTLAEPLVASLQFLGHAAELVVIASVTAVLAFVNLVIGELVPKRLAMQHAAGWSLLVARPLSILATAARPAVWLVSEATDVIVRALGGDPDVGKEELSPEELRDLVAEHRGLSAEQRSMLTAVLDIHQRPVREVLVPRRAVTMVPDDTPIERARELLVESGHSQAPVVRSHNLDDVVGVVHLRDLSGARATAADAARPYVSFPESLRVSDALRRFRTEREQFAVVVDEHGGVSGIVTIEDLVEEIVGEIYDETDRDVMAVHAMPDGSLILPGTFPLHDLPDIGVDLTDAAARGAATIAGLVLTYLGRVPEGPGDRVAFAKWTITVTQAAHNTVTEVRLTPRDGDDRGHPL